MNKQVRGARQSKKVSDYFLYIGCLDKYDDSNNIDKVEEKEINIDNNNSNNISNDNIRPPISSRLLHGIPETEVLLPDINKDQDMLRKLLKITYMAEVLDRYPLIDHEHMHLPQGIPLFCFPIGCEISAYQKNPSFYSFVITLENGSRVLGCCLKFYDLLTLDQLDDLVNSLRQEHFDEQEITMINNIQSGEIQLYLPRCICLISSWPFLTSFKQFLCGLYRLNREHLLRAPIERYICNFIDDVPAPPWGRVDVIHYLNDEPITFRCPPHNQPNVWSSLPLYPLFECLSPENILLLFSLILIEKQIVFISSQYSLLTNCAEAITSLLYPITWTHAYIPILPLQLIGVLGAPFPFIIGIHNSFLNHKDCSFNDEAVKVYLDDNIIQVNNLELPPLPERRAKKLLQVLQTSSKLFEQRPVDWNNSRRPYFDDAFSPNTSKPLEDSKGVSLINETDIRAGFLKFFVAILKNYRKFIVYDPPSSTSDDNYKSVDRFRYKEFLTEQPIDWQPYLELMISSQSFSHFIDERVYDITGDRDVIYFDESIDAKMNRYTFRTRNIDTPFLSNNSHIHTKTYVAPSPDQSNLSNDLIAQLQSNNQIFRRLNTQLFIQSRNLKIPFDPFIVDGHGINLERLKRIERTNISNSSSDHIDIDSCIYSIYLMTVCSFIIYSNIQRSARSATNPTIIPSTNKILDDFGSKLITTNGSRHNSTVDSTNNSSYDKVKYKQLIESERLALKVAFASLDCLTKLDKPPDELVYRSLVDACGLCGDFLRSTDVLVYLNCEGLLPDRQMLNSVVRAYSLDEFAAQVVKSTYIPTSSSSKSVNGKTKPLFNRVITSSDILLIDDWRSIRTFDGYTTLSKRNSAPNRPDRSIEDYSSSTLTKLLFGSSPQIKRSTTKDDVPFEEDSSLMNRLQDVKELSISTTIIGASKKLNRIMRLSEQLLAFTYPDIQIDLNHPLGTACANTTCNRNLTLVEIYQGFEFGNSNKYTTKCLYCNSQFVPRFAVKSITSQVVEHDELWCELLSPWTLRKEVITILLQDGIEVLLSRQFRDMSIQRAVVFWNLIVVFRIIGLPYAYLLSDCDISIAFPTNNQQSKNLND